MSWSVSLELMVRVHQLHLLGLFDYVLDIQVAITSAFPHLFVTLDVLVSLLQVGLCKSSSRFDFLKSLFADQSFYNQLVTNKREIAAVIDG